jgi:hypothetical protein
MKTVLYLTLFLGLLPSLAIAGVMELSLRHLDAAHWSGPVAFVVFGAIYLAMIGGGAYCMTRIRS